MFFNKYGLRRFLFAMYFCVSNQFGVTKEDFKILIKIPTRSRPANFFKCLDKYYEYLSEKVDCHFLISCDTDDRTMNCPVVIERLQRYKNLNFYFAKGVSKIEAYNRDINKHLDFDVVVVTSDDLLPSIKNYDAIIRDAMLQYFPDTDGVLQFDDGNPVRICGTLNTYPIIGKKFYDRFGYVYHPFYKSVYADNEITEVSVLLNKRKVLPEILFVHVHPGISLRKEYKKDHYEWDDLYKKNESRKMYDYDGKIYSRRKMVHFGLNRQTQSVVKLSILMPLPDSKIHAKLLQQIRILNLENVVEILAGSDSNTTLGNKLCQLLRKSCGEYIVCCPDKVDDLSEHYLSKIMQQLQSYPNFVQTANIKISALCHKDVVRRDILIDCYSDLSKAQKMSQLDRCFDVIRAFSNWTKTF